MTWDTSQNYANSSAHDRSSWQGRVSSSSTINKKFYYNFGKIIVVGGLAGGALEIGETLVETAKRELREETGLEAEHLKLLNVYSGDTFYYKYPHGDEVYNVISAFLCTAYSGEVVRDPSEVAELRFFAMDQLPENLNPPERPILMEYVQKQRTAHHVSIY